MSKERLQPHDRSAPDIIQRLEQAIGGIHDSEGFRRYLDVQSRFHHYSPYNALLIMFQHPDATRVAGYNAWLKMNRYVRKGEKRSRSSSPCSRPSATR